MLSYATHMSRISTLSELVVGGEDGRSIWLKATAVLKKNRKKLLNVRALLLNFSDALTVFQPLFGIHVLPLSIQRTESTS